MALLDVVSTNQIQAVSGRRRRPILGDILQASLPTLAQNRAFRLQQDELELARQEQANQGRLVARHPGAALAGASDLSPQWA